MSKHLEALLPWLFVAGLLIVWELACVAFRIPAFVLPSPSVITLSLYKYLGPIAENSWATLARTLVGFAIAVALGVLLGLGIGSSRVVYRGLYPVLVGSTAFRRSQLFRSSSSGSGSAPSRPCSPRSWCRSSRSR